MPDELPPGRCPRFPQKAKHATRGAAWAEVRRRRDAGTLSPDVLPYPCGDHFHVGHSRAAFERRLRKAIRRRR